MVQLICEAGMKILAAHMDRLQVRFRCMRSLNTAQTDRWLLCVQEAVQGHLQDTDQAVQSPQGPG